MKPVTYLALNLRVHPLITPTVVVVTRLLLLLMTGCKKETEVAPVMIEK